MDENPNKAPQAESARRRDRVRRWTAQQVWVGCVLAVLILIAIVGVYPDGDCGGAVERRRIETNSSGTA